MLGEDHMKSRWHWSVLLIGCMCLTGLTSGAQQSVTAPGGATASGAVPNLIKYSSVLKDGSGAVITALSGVTFLIYKDEQGGAPLWMETQNVQPDKAGRYTVQLGAVSKDGLPPEVFMTGEARWLAVQIGNEAEQARVTLVAVPYAMKAADAQTLGGLPASAFALAAPPNASPAAATTVSEVSGSTAAPGSSNVTTTGGTANTIPLFTTPTNIQNSILTQTGKTGVNVGGKLNLPATGTANSSKGFNSQPGAFVASVFNSGTSTPVPQTFQWQAEPVNNDTTTASGTLNLLFGQGTSMPAETGLKISSKGILSFATGQTFPGTGTVTSVNSGPGLTGGPITTTGTLSIPNAGVTNSMLANPALTVNAGTDLLGGGLVSLGGSTTLNLDTTKVPLLTANNNFTGNQIVNGNLSATGVVSGSSFQIGSNLFDYGSYSSQDAFLGFAGNGTISGTGNTASGFAALSSSSNSGLFNTADGFAALSSNTSGFQNTASGENALTSNTSGSHNAASGEWALEFNTTGSWNTAFGALAGYSEDGSNITGSNNTFIGYLSAMSTGTLNNATAIGAYAEVAASNAMVLGSINGVNGAAANTLVGIGTTAPSYLLHIGNQGGISYNNFLRVEGPATGSGNAISVGGHGDVGIDAPGVPDGRFVVKDNGIVAIGIPNPLINPFQIKQGLGHALADGWDTYSSRRWKTNIHTLHGALAKVEQLRGVSYNLKNSGKHEIGVIAEEVGVVVPEVVSWEENGTDARSVDYGRLTALLIEATKEQQALIHNQQEQIRAQQAQIARISSEIKVIQTSASGNRRTSSEIRPVKATMSVAKQ
jgi:hypothetical protein